MAEKPNGFGVGLLARYALDPRSLAAFRIAVGVLLLWDLAARVPDLVALYSDAGAVPRALVESEHAPPFLHRVFLATGSVAGTAALLGVFAVFALGLTLGCFTRTCTIACWLLWSSWMARNPYVLNFGDRILRVALFWAIFLPLGGAFSFDARRAPERAPPAVSLASLAYQLQIVIVYFVGALHKNHPIWTTGQAISYVVEFDQVTRPLGHALSAHPRLMEVLTYATLLFEAVLVPLVFSPFKTALLRGALVVVAIGFHVGLGLTLFLGHFPAVCIAMWLPFVPAGFWDRLVRLGRLGELGGAIGALPSPQTTSRVTATTLLVSAALGIVLLYNAATLREGGEVPEPLDSIARRVGLDQRWTMFAPHPSRIDGWFVVSGHRGDGTLVDAWKGEGAPSYAKPDDPRTRYAHHRWMTYMVKLHVDRERSAQSLHLADHLCRRWNRAHPDAPIDHLSIDFMQELTLPGGLEDDPIRAPIVRHPCATSSSS